MGNKVLRTLALAAIAFIASNMGAQAPHPERVYLSGTGIDDTRTWDFYCTHGQNSGKWKPIEVPCNPKIRKQSQWQSQLQ